MKILHTSDWHLGHTLYDHGRMAEHEDFLRQLKTVVGEQQPDALLVCGDVFDRVAAPVAARELYVRALLDMHDICPAMQIIVTAGNHDGKSALETEGLIWGRLHVKVIGQVEFDDDGQVNFDRHIVEIRDAQGCLLGFVAAVPHIYEYGYPQMGDAEDRNDRQKLFFQTLLDKVAERNPDKLPVVLSAHLAMAGGNFAGHTFSDSIGGIETVKQEQLGTGGYDYLALGHIHSPQTLPGSKPVARYCGTPIAISFDETGHHGVTMVTLEKGVPPVIEEIEIRNPKPLLTLPGKPALFEDALQELREFPDTESAYIRLNVLLDGPLPPNHIEQILQILDRKKAEYCCVVTSLPSREEKSGGNVDVKPVDADNMPEPGELADRFFQKKYNVSMDADLAELLRKAIEVAQKNEIEH